jgi:hypothetical protein
VFPALAPRPASSWNEQTPMLFRSAACFCPGLIALAAASSLAGGMSLGSQNGVLAGM